LVRYSVGPAQPVGDNWDAKRGRGKQPSRTLSRFESTALRVTGETPGPAASGCLPRLKERTAGALQRGIKKSMGIPADLAGKGATLWENKPPDLHKKKQTKKGGERETGRLDLQKPATPKTLTRKGQRREGDENGGRGGQQVQRNCNGLQKRAPGLQQKKKDEGGKRRTRGGDQEKGGSRRLEKPTKEDQLGAPGKDKRGGKKKAKSEKEKLLTRRAKPD